MENDFEYFFDEVDSCEEIGQFEDEWVYDVEVDDSTHTFITNDLLVHNSLFVSFEPCLNHCDWQNQVISRLDQIKKDFIVYEMRQVSKTNNPNCKGIFREFGELLNFLKTETAELLVIDGYFIKSKELKNPEFIELVKNYKILWNWSEAIDFIHGVDYFKVAGFFKQSLEEYADSFGVKNREDFELERISESVINLAKKKYIQHILFEDGISYDKLSYIFPKGVELVRSSTPAFARDKIIGIVKYLFSNPDTFNIKELLRLVKNLRKEFELADVDDISMQSSVSKYETKVLDDVSKLSFVTGAHFAVKASAYYNFLLHKNKSAQSKYEFIKSGTKIKYYYCKNNKTNDIFAYIRGDYPIEFAPEVDYDVQFYKSIISPINSIIEPLGMPSITNRLSVVLDIFGKV